MAIDLSFIPDDPQAQPVKKSSLDLSFIPDEETPSGGLPGRQEVISTYKGPPKWDSLSFWDKLATLANPMTTGSGLREVFRESPEDAQAKAINSYALAQKLKTTPAMVYENYDKIIKDPNLTGMSWSGPGRDSSSPITRAYELGEGLSKQGFPALIGAGLVTAPLATLKAVGIFTGVSEGLKAGGSVVAGKPYHFGMEAADLLPADSSETMKSIFNAAEFLGSALATGGLVKGWNKIIPGVRSSISEKLFRDVITEFKAPEKIYVSPEKVRDLQLGKEDFTNDLIKDLDLTGSRWRQALRMGVDIEIPAEKLIRTVDKPWFGRIKEDLNKTGIFSLSPFERVRVEWAGETTGRPRPSGLLPAPREEAAPGPLTSAGPGEPGSSSSLPLYQTELRPATEALNRVKSEIMNSGFDQEYADSVAALLDARSRTWAIQTGKTPAEYFEKWGVEFKRGIWYPGDRRRESANLGGKKETLIGWLKQRGGIWDQTLPGETAQFGARESGMVGLVRKGSGQAFDELADHAVQDGWLPEGATAREFIDLLSKDIRAVKEKKPEARAIKLSESLDRQVAMDQAASDQAMIDLGEDAQRAIGLGYDYFGLHNEITAGSLTEGDKVIILGEEYEHKGLDENGQIRLTGKADEYLVGPDEILPAEAVKYINPSIHDGPVVYQFAGEKALGVDRSMLVRAIKMQAGGLLKDQIWKETGWIKGVDDKWRFEIDDSGAKINYGAITEKDWDRLKEWDEAYINLEDLLNHPVLFKNYPELKDLNVHLRSDYKGGAFNGVEITVGIYLKTGQVNLPVLLHEIQHVIQFKEGFAIGGFPSDMPVRDIDTSGFYGEVRDLLNEIEAIQKKPNYKGKKDDLKKLGDEWRARMNKGDALRSEEINKQRFRDYRHLAGEAEARETANRFGLNVEERAGNIPGYDGIPNKDLLVRFNPWEDPEVLFQRPTPKLRSIPIPPEVGFSRAISSHSDSRKFNKNPDFSSAKSGDREAAERLVWNFIKPETIEAVKKITDPETIFVFPHAQEAGGLNQIPAALATYYAVRTGGKIDRSIIQTNRTFHSGAPAMERLISPAHFDGEVIPGGKYILFDDVGTLGGTMANLSHFIQEKGGKIISIVHLTDASRQAKINPDSKLIRKLEKDYEKIIREEFGIEPAALTAAEAGYLSKFRDADALRNRIAQARQERSDRLLSKGIQSPTGSDQSVNLFQVGQAPKGSLSFTDQHKAIITFFQSADLSTAPHEIFHLFLEDLRDTALTPGVPDQIKKDFQTTLDWLGVKSWDEITTAHKERWARAGEKYLGSGKAPSEDLRGVFTRFKEWILSIYQKLQDLNVNLTKKMRGVFDRLLATEEEIQAAKAEMDIKPLWDERMGPPLGISPEAWAQYGELARRAAQATNAAIEQRRIAEYNEAKAGWTKEAQESYKQNLEHQLIEIIVEKGGLNKERLLQEFDEATVNALSRRRPGMVREGGTMYHDMVAMGSGDISTEKLVDLLINAQTKEEFIEQYIKAQSEEFDSKIPLGEQAITDEYLSMLQREMDILMAAATKGQGRVIKNSEVKKRIRIETNQTRVDNLVTETDALRAGLHMAARAARQAMAAGKVEEALIQKGRQREIVMNLKAKYEAQREIDQARAYFGRVVKSPSIDWDFKAQIMDILADHEIISRQDFPREGMPTLRKFVAELQASGEMLDISDAMLDRAYVGPMKGRTYEQLMDIRDTVKQLEHLGRIQNKLIAEEKARDLEEVLREITGRIFEVYRKKFKEPAGFVEFEARKNILQKAGEYKDTFIAELLKPEVIIRLLDGLKDQGMGPVWQNTFAKIKAAEDKEIVMGREFTKRLQEIFDAIPKAERHKWLDQKIAIPEIPQKFLTKDKIIMVALNSGNEGNRRALREGSGADPEMKWTDTQIQAITDKLNKEEWDLVQNVWSLINELYKPLNETHRALTGVPLKKVEGMAVQTPYGEIEGQYFPLVFDSKLSQKAEQFMLAQAEKDFFANYYNKPTPVSGFTKERVGGKMFPLLDFSVITKHINDVIHFSTHALEVRDVNKILSSGELRASIEQALGEAVYKQLNPWLQNVARSQYQPITAIERTIGKLRANTAIVVLGVKASTALMQPLAAFQGIDYVGLVPWLKGLATFYSHPWEWSGFVQEKSPMMSVRYSRETLDREMALFAKQFNPAGDSLMAAAQQAFFAWMNVMDAGVAYPTWMAAYKQGMDKFNWHEAKAAEYADQAVRLSQASSAVKDQALFYQGKEGLKKLFGMFQTFFNAFFNRIIERNRGFGLGEVGIGGLMAAYTWLVLLPATVQYMIQDRKLPGPWDVGRESINYLASGIPLVRDLANLIFSDYDARPSPAFKVYDEASYLKKTITAKDPKWRNIIGHGLQVAGYGLGLPTAQAVITMKAIFDLIEGKEINPLNLLLREPKEKKK